MTRKIFALASVTAFAGVVFGGSAAGCSDDTPGVSGSGTDSGTDGRRPPPNPGPEQDAAEPESCMVKEEIDPGKFHYAKANVVPGSCTEKEIDAIGDFYKTSIESQQKEPSIKEWKGEVSEKCAACVFSDGSGSTLTPMVEKSDALDYVNVGGCIEIRSGKEACGAAYQRTIQCIIEACITNCKTQAEFEACQNDGQKIAQGPCRQAYAQLEKDCDTQTLQGHIDACRIGEFTFVGPITFQCGGDAPDGGDDAGDDGDGT